MLEKVMWAASYLKKKAFARFKFYISHYLKRGNAVSYNPIVTKVVNTVGYYLELLS
jgi:hypothetical protein